VASASRRWILAVQGAQSPRQQAQPAKSHRRGVLEAVKAALASLGGFAGLDRSCAFPVANSQNPFRFP
jgi:hypothetical protein